MNTDALNEILEYVIPALIMLAGTVITVKTESKKQQDKAQEQSDLTLYRLDQLEEKQDKYNNLQGRMFNAEKLIDLAHEKIKVANHRLDDLEHKNK